MDNKDIGIRALDMQTGLYKYNDSLLDLKIGETMLIGKAASLASHLRGIQVVEDYDALKVLASKLGITSTELVTVLNILQEVELIRIIGSSRKPEKIEILISVFESVVPTFPATSAYPSIENSIFPSGISSVTSISAI